MRRFLRLHQDGASRSVRCAISRLVFAPYACCLNLPWNILRRLRRCRLRREGTRPLGHPSNAYTDDSGSFDRLLETPGQCPKACGLHRSVAEGSSVSLGESLSRLSAHACCGEAFLAAALHLCNVRPLGSKHAHSVEKDDHHVALEYI